MDSTNTCWSLIRGAAAREGASRAEFAHRYTPVIRAFFLGRWRGRPTISDLDDAVQEVFVDCFREGGALERARPGAGAGFRPFLRGVARNVALRFEERARRRTRGGAEVDLDRFEDDAGAASRQFDRAWAGAIMQEAAARMEALARERGSEAERRVALLRRRFEDGLPIRAIAAEWQCDPAQLHREYAKARREFRDALLEVVAFHHPGARDEVEQECLQLLELFRTAPA